MDFIDESDICAVSYYIESISYRYCKMVYGSISMSIYCVLVNVCRYENCR